MRGSGALLGATLLTGAFGAQAQAQQQQCFSDSIPIQTTGWSDTLTVPLFDPALGILKSVEFELSTVLQGQAGFESLDASPAVVTTDFAATITVFRPGGMSSILVNSPSQNFVTNVTAFDGTIDFMGSSGATFPNISVADVSTTISPPPPSDLALFTGVGTIDLPVVAAGTSSGTGAGNLIQQFMQTAGAELMVCYNYNLDCNLNGIPDDDELDPLTDCNSNGTLDECEDFSDCNSNGIPDECDATGGNDCNSNGTPDDCEPDCNMNGTPDDCDVMNMTSNDCDNDLVPDECEPDCNFTGIPDDCDMAIDLDMNGIPDECETGTDKCNGDGGNQMGCTDCPCGNNAAAGTTGGCLNSASSSARLYVTGFPSVMNDTLTFRVTGGAPSTAGVLFSGSSGLPQNAVNPCFGLNSGIQFAGFDGLRCVGGTVNRHPARQSDANGDFGFTTAPWGPPGGPPQGLIARGNWMPGQTTCWQVIYRDDNSQVCMTGVNTTQALEITITP